MTSRRTLPALCCAMLLALAACGGGGGGGTEPASPAPGPDPGQPAPPPAPAAEGVLYVQTAEGDELGYGGLDLATGVLSIVRGNGGSSAAPDGTEFAAIESDDHEMLAPDDHTTELVIFGLDGRANARFGRAGWIGAPVRLSADRQRVAFAYEGDDGQDLLNVSDREGRVLARYSGLSSWDWAGDGSLYAAGGDTLYRIGADLGPPVPVQRFPGDQPMNVAVSPDGTRLAFSLGDREARRNHVHVMNVDGSALRQLTTSASNEDNPAWSPDGREIAVRQGLVYGIALEPTGSCATAWRVPADGTRVNLDRRDATTPARELTWLDDGRSRTLCTFGRLDWRPAVALPRRDGTTTQGGGLNRGLSGRLFFDAAGSMRRLDLASGTFLNWPGAGGAPYPSSDGQEVLFSSDDDRFVIGRADGSVAASLPAAGYLVRPQLSADGQLITARGWLDDGPSGMAVHLFARSGAYLGRGPEGWESSAWLPDGRLLMAARERLALIDAARTTLTPLVALGDPVSDLAVSPDGRQIAFVMAGHVWLLGIDGTGLRQLTVSSGSESTPAWSPDGRHVIVRPAGGCGLQAVPADGERVFVGNASVPSSAWTLQMVEDSRTRTVCAFSQPHWR